MVNSIQVETKTVTNFYAAFKQIKVQFPILHNLASLHFVAFLFSVIAIFIDDRQLMGINVWIKPSKFLLSTFVLLWTVGWYLLFYPFREKEKLFIAYGMTFLLTVENILISMQAARGVMSHYNSSSFLDAAIFSTMGLAIGLFTLLVVWIFIRSFSSKLLVPNAMRWGFRIAWFTFLFGSAVGGGSMIEQNAHTVGLPDGGTGIPFLNWSNVGGDLRIAHFLGIHAIQIIPMGIFIIHKYLEEGRLATRLAIGFAMAYLVWIILTFYQAKLGHPFLDF